MHRVSDEQIGLLLEGIEGGMSRRKLAQHARVSVRTAVSYRQMYIDSGLGELPSLCGCGRPRKHTGRCNSRRCEEGKEK